MDKIMAVLMAIFMSILGWIATVIFLGSLLYFWLGLLINLISLILAFITADTNKGKKIKNKLFKHLSGTNLLIGVAGILAYLFIYNFMPPSFLLNSWNDAVLHSPRF